MDILLTVHVFVVVAMIFVILIQRSSNDGFTGTSGNNPEAMLSGAAKGNGLTKLTGILATIFIVNSMVMTYLASADRPVSILETDGNNIIVPNDDVIPNVPAGDANIAPQTIPSVPDAE